MNKKYRELKYLWLFLAILSTLWFAQKVKAETNNIEIIYPGKPAPLFSETNIAPKQKITKQITIRNNYSTPQDLGIQTLNISDPDFGSVLMLEISNPATLLSSSLLALAEPKETFITSISPGDTQLNLSAYLDKTATNQYQNKKISFDIKFGFLKKEEGVLGEEAERPVQKPGISLPFWVWPLLFLEILALFYLLFGQRKKTKK